MLPTDLSDLIARFAWGVTCSLHHELDTLIRFRECVPPCLLMTQVRWANERFGRCLNPWYRGFPYTPFALLEPEPPFIPAMRNLTQYMGRSVYQRFRTYPKVFQRHLDNFFLGNSTSWNKVLRFLVAVRASYEDSQRVPITLLEILFDQLEGAVLLPKNFSVPWHGAAKFWT